MDMMALYEKLERRIQKMENKPPSSRLNGEQLRKGMILAYRRVQRLIEESVK